MRASPISGSRSLSLCLLSFLAWATPAWAQIDIKIRDKAAVAAPARPPVNELVPREPVGVLVIPDVEILRGASLTDPQRETILWNLKIAPFRTARPQLNRPEQQALRLPSGELFQLMSAVVVPQTLMQQTPTAPGLATNACSESGVDDTELTALRQLLSAQLKSRGVDDRGFLNGYPRDCRREQLLYLVKSARIVAAK